MKIATTSIWWIFLIGVIAVTAAALWTSGVSHHFTLDPPLATMGSAARAQAIAQAAQARTRAGATAITVNMITAGQFLGVLFALLLGVLLSTNETAHQTAAITFLTTPRRTLVINAKVAAAACFGALCWLVSTTVTAVTTPLYLHSQHLTAGAASGVVIRSVLLNLLIYVLWAVFGVGLGTLIRSQVAAVIAGIACYLAGYAAVELIFHALYSLYPHGWVLGAAVIAPAVAGTVAISPGHAFPHAPPQWAGIVVMAAYALVLAVGGIAATRRRDVV
jgi:hypothetical protein